MAKVPVFLGQDTITHSYSGTGKTGTFAISILQRLDMELRQPQALVLVQGPEEAVAMRRVRACNAIRAATAPCLTPH